MTRFLSRMTSDPREACETYEYGEMELHEVIRQEYDKNSCVLSAGIVEGHPIDTLFLRLARDGEEPTNILLRPDEAQAIIWLLSGALWSHQMDEILSQQQGVPDVS